MISINIMIMRIDGWAVRNERMIMKKVKTFMEKWKRCAAGEVHAFAAMDEGRMTDAQMSFSFTSEGRTMICTGSIMILDIADALAPFTLPIALTVMSWTFMLRWFPA